MKAIRFGSALVSALCIAGTALGQNNPLRTQDPYGVQLTRLDDESCSQQLFVRRSGNGNAQHLP